MLRYFLIFFLLSGCSSYERSNLIEKIQPTSTDVLNVKFEMSFNSYSHYVDEIEISSKYQYEHKINTLKGNILNYLTSVNPNLKINIVKSDEKLKGCVLNVNFNETLGSKSPMFSAFTLFLWPYIDNREVTLTSKLLKNNEVISHYGFKNNL